MNDGNLCQFRVATLTAKNTGLVTKAGKPNWGYQGSWSTPETGPSIVYHSQRDVTNVTKQILMRLIHTNTFMLFMMGSFPKPWPDIKVSKTLAPTCIGEHHKALLTQWPCRSFRRNWDQDGGCAYRLSWLYWDIFARHGNDHENKQQQGSSWKPCNAMKGKSPVIQTPFTVIRNAFGFQNQTNMSMGKNGTKPFHTSTILKYIQIHKFQLDVPFFWRFFYKHLHFPFPSE